MIKNYILRDDNLFDDPVVEKRDCDPTLPGLAFKKSVFVGTEIRSNKN